MRCAIGAAERIEYRHETSFAQPTPPNDALPGLPLGAPDDTVRGQETSLDRRFRIIDAEPPRKDDETARQGKDARDGTTMLL